MRLAARTWCWELTDTFPADENGAVGLGVAAGEDEVVDWRHCVLQSRSFQTTAVTFVFACLIGRFGQISVLGCHGSYLYLSWEHKGHALRALTMSKCCLYCFCSSFCSHCIFSRLNGFL